MVVHLNAVGTTQGDMQERKARIRRRKNQRMKRTSNNPPMSVDGMEKVGFS